MTKTEGIIHQLKRSFDGEAWHGPALMEVLKSVDAATASAHPVANAHCIWELALHVRAWEWVAIRRLQGHEATVSDQDNFPNPAKVDDAAWRQEVTALRETHAELVRLVAALPEERLQQRAPGTDYDLEFMLLGVVQHAAYHGGQIALLGKAHR